MDQIEETARQAFENEPALARWAQMLSTRNAAVNKQCTSDAIEAFERAQSDFNLLSIWEQIFWRSALQEEYVSSEILNKTNALTVNNFRKEPNI